MSYWKMADALDVLTGHTATNTRVDDGGTLDVRNGGTATTVSMGNGGVLLADSGAAVSGTRSDGKAFSIGGGQADALMLEKRQFIHAERR